MQLKNNLSHSVIVELYGLPGSGKTSLGKQLERHYPREVFFINDPGKLQRLWYVSLFILNFPQIFFRWLFAWWFFSERGLRRYQFHLLSISLAKTMMAARASSSFVIIDEGLYQRVLSLANKDVSVATLRRWLKLMPVVDRVLIMPGGDFYRFTEDEDRYQSPRYRLGSDYLMAWRAQVVRLDQLIRQTLGNDKKQCLFVPEAPLENQVIFVGKEFGLEKTQ